MNEGSELEIRPETYNQEWGKKIFLKKTLRLWRGFVSAKCVSVLCNKNLANSSANHERKKQESCVEKVNVKNVCGSGGKV